MKVLLQGVALALAANDAQKHGFQSMFIKDWYGKQGRWWPLSTCGFHCAASPGCMHCLGHIAQKALGKRLRAKFLSENLLMPLKRWKKRTVIFVCPQGDLFHPEIAAIFIAQVFAVMAWRDDHVYIVLTKRATRMEELLCDPNFEKMVLKEGCKLFGDEFTLESDWGRNLLVGVSVEDQARMVRAEILPRLPKRFKKVLFTAPLLEALIIPPEVLKCLSWVVCNRERGSTVCDPRPCKVEWIESLLEQCREASVPFFLEDKPEKKIVWALGELPREYPPILARKY